MFVNICLWGLCYNAHVCILYVGFVLSIVFVCGVYVMSDTWCTCSSDSTVTWSQRIHRWKSDIH